MDGGRVPPENNLAASEINGRGWGTNEDVASQEIFTDPQGGGFDDMPMGTQETHQEMGFAAFDPGGEDLLGDLLGGLDDFMGAGEEREELGELEKVAPRIQSYMKLWNEKAGSPE